MLRALPRIAVDAHTVGRRATGNETYVANLLEALAERGRVEPVALTDRRSSAPFEQQLLRWRHPIPRLLMDLRNPRDRWRADALHVQYVRPPWCDVPVITTVHDISFEHFPHMFRKATVLRMRSMIPWSARRSAAVLTGSEYSRRDLIESYDLPPDKVHVTLYATSNLFTTLPTAEARRRVGSLDVPGEYILYVGNLQPRKNLPRLLDAYRLLRERGWSVPLVIVGQRAWLADDVFDTVRRHSLGEHVKFTGYVSDEQLVGLYNLAHVMVYPSLFEGFGLPVLEALACGAPTVTSSTSSMPEVAGDAALLVDPTDVDEIANAIERLLADASLRDRLRAAGPRQAARFSWDRCAQQTESVYRAVLDG